MYPEPSTAQKIISNANKGALRRLKQVRKEHRALTWTDVFTNVDGPKAASGVPVNEQKSLQIVAVYACVSFIADYVACLPKLVYERLSRGKRRAPEHPLFDIIHNNPNPFMNHYEFVETLTGHAVLWGNAYAEIERRNGQIVALWPLRPDQMEVQINNGELFYYYTTPDRERRQILTSNIFHLRGLGNDGIIGYSPIRLARESIGLAFAEEEYRARFFSGNASPGGVLEAPGSIGDSEKLRRQWQQAHSGLTNAHRVAVLENGVKWHQIGLPAKDIEFIEGRKFQKSEIASLFRVKPVNIGIMEPGTVSFASVEQQAIDTHIYTGRPWVLRWEARLNTLFTPRERQRFFTEFLFDGLLRADSESRARVLQILRQNGIFNADDWLELENRNPLPDGKGQDYWMPSNMQVVGEEPDDEPDELPIITNPTNGNGARPTNGSAE